MQKLCCVCTRQQFSASLDYFVTSSPPYLHQFSTISGGNCITSSHSDGDDDDNVAPPLAAPGGPAGVINAASYEASDATDEASEATTDEEDDTTETSAPQALAASQPGYKSEPDETIIDTDHLNPTLAIPDMTVSGPTDPPQPGGNTGVGTAPVPESTGVDTEPGGNTGVGTAPVLESTGVGITRKQQLHKMQLRHNKRSYEHWFINQHSRAYDEANKEMAPSMIEDIESPFRYIFQTEQMSLKKGLKAFGKSGADAVVEELRQLDYMQVIKPKHRADLSADDRHKALNYLMYLKQKRCGRIKARGCADGRKQRVYKGKDETGSPTVSTEALFLSCVIDAQEGRKVTTMDIPGAFMHSEMDEVLHLQLDGPMAELLCKVDEKKYRQYVYYEKKKPVLYASSLWHSAGCPTVLDQPVNVSNRRTWI